MCPALKTMKIEFISHCPTQKQSLGFIWFKTNKEVSIRTLSLVQTSLVTSREQRAFNRSTHLQLVDDHGPIQGDQHRIQEAQLHKDRGHEEGRQLEGARFTRERIGAQADGQSVRDPSNEVPPGVGFRMRGHPHRSKRWIVDG